MNRTVGGVIVCVALLGAVRVRAEQAGGNAAELQEVVVTAEKVAQSVQTAPISVSVFNQEKLTAMGAQSFVDYAGSVPALAFESLAPGEQRILLRGVSDGVDTGLRNQTQNTTGIYIDDMVVSNNETAPDLNLFDVDRVEVLKGPQGTLYGDGSVGGLVRVITRKADPSRTEGAIEASGAAINHGGGDYSVNGMYNVPLVQDTLALRLVAQYRDNQGFIDDVKRGRDDVNNLRQTGARASLRWTPTDATGFTISVLHQRTSIGGDNDYNSLLGVLKRGTLFGEPKDTRFNLFNATADFNLGWGELLSSSSYSVYDRDDHGDFTDFLTTAFSASFGIDGVVLPSYSEERQHAKDFSQELRLSSRGNERLDWIAGLYFFKMDEASFEHDHSNGLFDFFDALGEPIAGTEFDVGKDVAFSSDFTTHRRQFAAFGEVSYHLSDALTATVGARWFRDENSESTDAGGLFNGGSASLSKSAADHNQIFRFRLADQVGADTLIYALASQGYRTGGLNPLNPVTTNNPLFPQSFDPDKLWNYELGWKTRWFDRRLTLNGALFYIDWNNEQIEVPLPSGFSVIANAGKTTIKGAEFDLSARPIEHLEAGISGSYIHAVLGRDLLDATDPANVIVIGRSGDRLTGVPRFQGSLYAQWSAPLTGDIVGVVRGDLQYAAKTARYFASDQRVPAPAADFQSYGDYTLVNLRCGVEWRDFAATFFVKNLTDRRAELFHGGQGTSVLPTRDDIYVAQPRTIGVTLAKSF